MAEGSDRERILAQEAATVFVAENKRSGEPPTVEWLRACTRRDNFQNAAMMPGGGVNFPELNRWLVLVIEAMHEMVADDLVEVRRLERDASERKDRAETVLNMLSQLPRE